MRKISVWFELTVAAVAEVSDNEVVLVVVCSQCLVGTHWLVSVPVADLMMPLRSTPCGSTAHTVGSQDTAH